MSILDVIKKRVSVRSYDSQHPVEEAVLKEILEAGRLAPSATNAQPWEFWLISSSEMLEKIRRCYDREWFAGAPLVLIVTGHKSQAWTRSSDGYNSIETDLAIAMDHMILAATETGLGSCWIANFDPQCLKKALGLSQEDAVFAMTPLGYPAKDFIPGKKRRKPFEKVVKFNL